MTTLTATERAVWAAWHALPEAEPAPVKSIAVQLGMAPADVAFVVYPAERFGPWADGQEPDGCCREAILERREEERPRALELLVDMLEGVDLDCGPHAVASELLDRLTGVGFRVAPEWEPCDDDEEEEL